MKISAKHKSVISQDRKLLPGLTGILGRDVHAELTLEDTTLKLMRRAVDAIDYEEFYRIYPYIKTFWNSFAVIDECIVIDNCLAIPQCFQRAVFARLPRAHPGKEDMIDAANTSGDPEFTGTLSAPANIQSKAPTSVGS